MSSPETFTYGTHQTIYEIVQHRDYKLVVKSGAIGHGAVTVPYTQEVAKIYEREGAEKEIVVLQDTTLNELTELTDFLNFYARWHRTEPAEKAVEPVSEPSREQVARRLAIILFSAEKDRAAFVDLVLREQG